MTSAAGRRKKWINVRNITASLVRSMSIMMVTVGITVILAISRTVGMSAMPTAMSKVVVD